MVANANADFMKAWRKKKRPVREAPGDAALLDVGDDQERDILLLV